MIAKSYSAFRELWARSLSFSVYFLIYKMGMIIFMSLIVMRNRSVIRLLISLFKTTDIFIFF